MKNRKYTGEQLNEPSIKYAWYKNNQLHREDGPAVEFIGGTKWWYLNGKRHRLDGPAREQYDGTKFWYYHGEHIKCKYQEEFERITKLLSFK